MNKIIDPKEAITISEQLRKANKTVVLAGGVFDILHGGHIDFLENAKKQGDILMVTIESDVNVGKKKGPSRPIHRQADRAKVVAALLMVDYVICLPTPTEDKDYDYLVFTLKPAIIATTKGDKEISHKKRQGDTIGAQVVEVIEPIPNASTTRLAKLLEKEL